MQISLNEYPKEIEFVRNVLLKGHFREAAQFLEAFENKLPLAQLKQLTLKLYKQKLYELLEDPNKNDLQDLFEKELVDLCSEEEYTQLFNLLTCSSIKQIPGFENWSPMTGRYECFEEIETHILPFFKGFGGKQSKSNKTGLLVPLQEIIDSYVNARQKLQLAPSKGQMSSKSKVYESDHYEQFMEQEKEKSLGQSKTADNFRGSKLHVNGDSRANIGSNDSRVNIGSSDSRVNVGSNDSRANVLANESRTSKYSNKQKPIENISSNEQRTNMVSNNSRMNVNSNESRASRYTNKEKPIETSNVQKSNKSYSNVSSSQSQNRSQRTFQEEMKIKNRQQIEALDMSQSKLQDSKLLERGNQFSFQPDTQNQQKIMEKSTFSRKNNPYVGVGTSSYINKSQMDNHSVLSKRAQELKPLHVQDYDEESHQVSQSNVQQTVSEKEEEFARSDLRNKYTYLQNENFAHQHEEQGNDTEIIEEQVRKNIAYLQNNNQSYATERQQEHENFTFSNGAEQNTNFQPQGRQILKLCSFTDPKAIRACQFSPSGNLFALGTNSSYLKLYDLSIALQTNEPDELVPLCQIPQLHTKSIFSLEWSKDERSIVTCSNDLTIKVTDFNDNFKTHKSNVIGRHESCIRMVKFGHRDNRIVSCGDDSLIKVWDIGKIKRCANLKGHTQSVSAFKFRQLQSSLYDDNILYSVSKDCSIRKWDLRTNECVSVSDVQHSEVTYIANNTQNKIVVAHKNGCVGWFTEELQFEHSLQVHEQEIRSIDGTRMDGQTLLLTASFDGYLAILDADNPDEPVYHQHNLEDSDKVVFATWLNSGKHNAFASSSTLGICNVYSYQ